MTAATSARAPSLATHISLFIVLGRDPASAAQRAALLIFVDCVFICLLGIACACRTRTLLGALKLGGAVCLCAACC